MTLITTKAENHPPTEHTMPTHPISKSSAENGKKGGRPRCCYRVVKLTGATLVDRDLRGQGPETGGVISRHQTLEAAEARCAYLSSDAMGRIRCAVQVLSDGEWSIV